MTAAKRNAWQVWLVALAMGLPVVQSACRQRREVGEEPGRQDVPGVLPQEIITEGGIEMVLVPAGECLMGSDAAVDARPVHGVSVKSFYMDRYEVTQDVYETIMGENPSRRKNKTSPVERVRWTDAVKFCNARSRREGLQPCYDLTTRECRFDADGYRLPTEAEWEFACRAGGTENYYFGANAEDLDSYGWFKRNARRRPHPVGEKRPNPFGLCDMAGNVWEWCSDWYEVDYYQESPKSDPRGPAHGEKKVLRGGAFSSTADSCSSWTRYCDEPGFSDACVASDDYGFRCTRRAASSD